MNRAVTLTMKTFKLCSLITSEPTHCDKQLNPLSENSLGIYSKIYFTCEVALFNLLNNILIFCYKLNTVCEALCSFQLKLYNFYTMSLIFLLIQILTQLYFVPNFCYAQRDVYF